MVNFDFKKLLPHLGALVVFIIITLTYFSPVLQGKQIRQSDIVQYSGMAKQRNDIRDQEKRESYWTDAAFGGMPTYQLGALYPHNYIKKLDTTLRFLPRPADYVFLYFACFYVLLLVLKIDWRFAILGSISFGLSTYYIIILGVGHNAKAHAIAYMPLILAGIFLVFQRKYWLGGAVTAIAMGLEINANHYQMTYYLGIAILVLGLVKLVSAFKNKEVQPFLKAIGVLIVGVGIGIGMNATSLLATSEYAQESTRGKSEITINPDGTEKERTSGLSKEYITTYSYGIGESFNLFVPNLYGGSKSVPLPEDSNFVKKVTTFTEMPSSNAQAMGGSMMYWGDQPIVAAPAYIGAIVLFLFVLALFVVKGRMKIWIVGATLLTLFLSWGKNFNVLTDLFIDYVPLYDKFRAVSSIQVIVELLVPLLAILGLYQFITNTDSKKEKIKTLYKAFGVTAGIGLFLYVLKGTGFNFVSPEDGRILESIGPELMSAIREDRAMLYANDVIRTLIYVTLTAVVLWLFLKEKIKTNVVLVSIGLLIIFDLVGVDRRYVNNENFVSARLVTNPHMPLPADAEILKDKGHYRVIDMTTYPFSNARASFFHKSIGGYHAAKPKRVEDIHEFYISKNHVGVLNMLNIKYILKENKNNVVALNNPYTNGNAWFISDIEKVATANEELLGINKLDSKNKAIVNQTGAEQLKSRYAVDSVATINLVDYKTDELKYTSENKEDGFAVFSEIYYENGWKAYVDGTEVPIFKTNYLLRGIEVPKGKREILFKFEPQVVKTGSTISLISTLLLIVLLGLGWFYNRKNTALSTTALENEA